MGINKTALSRSITTRLLSPCFAALRAIELGEVSLDALKNLKLTIKKLGSG